MSVEASPKGVKKKHRRVVTEQYDTPGRYKQRISLLVGLGSVGRMQLEHFHGFTPSLLKYGQPGTSISKEITLAPWLQHCHRDL